MLILQDLLGSKINYPLLPLTYATHYFPPRRQYMCIDSHYGIVLHDIGFF